AVGNAFHPDAVRARIEACDAQLGAGRRGARDALPVAADDGDADAGERGRHVTQVVEANSNTAVVRRTDILAGDAGAEHERGKEAKRNLVLHDEPRLSVGFAAISDAAGMTTEVVQAARAEQRF